MLVLPSSEKLYTALGTLTFHVNYDTGAGVRQAGRQRTTVRACLDE